MKMNDKFFPELSRRLKREGISTGPVEKASLPVLVEGRQAMWVQSWGGVIFNAGSVNDPAVDLIHDTVAEISAQVYEYTEAMAAAPSLKAVGLHEDFRLLAEFNGIILAGQELEADWGYKFVTWRRSPDRKAVNGGEYFDGGHFYEAAKLDFACRARLVQESRQFSNEQLAEVYRCIHETLDSEYPITDQRRKTLEQVTEQIESSVDDLDELVGQSNQRELDAAREQGRAGPNMEF